MRLAFTDSNGSVSRLRCDDHGYGVQLISVWRNLAQMKSRYPQDWASILNNSGVLLSCGQSHYGPCREYVDVLGKDASELMRMGKDEAALSIRGGRGRSGG